MAKKKNTEPPVVVPEVQPNAGSTSTLDEDYNQFLNTTSQLTPDDDKLPPEVIGADGQKKPAPVAITPEQRVKVRMLLGFFCFILSWGNTIVLNMIFKAEVPVSELELDETEKNSILPYLESPEVITFIENLPVWLIAVVHIESMFIEKFMAVKDQYPKQEKGKVRKLPEQEKEEEKEETEKQ